MVSPKLTWYGMAKCAPMVPSSLGDACVSSSTCASSAGSCVVSACKEGDVQALCWCWVAVEVWFVLRTTDLVYTSFQPC